MKYDNFNDYIEALEHELERISQGNETYLVELRKDMALERLAARFDPEKSAAKGGFGVRGRDVLAFADVENPVITTVSREYLAADKVTLFLEQGVEGDRPRDVVHAALLLEDGKYNEAALASWLEKLGERRGVAAYLTEPLAEPPKVWAMKVNSICDRYGLQLNVEQCYDRIGGVCVRSYPC